MLFVIPEVEKPIKIIDTDVRTTIDDNGNMVITRKMDAIEIAELFDMPLSDVLNGAAKLGICTIEKLANKDLEKEKWKNGNENT